MALTAVACLTACDDSSSSSSNEIPTYKTEAALPDTCEMEVAKAGDTYFACFENKWVEVTDSATVEKLKEGLDEDDLKEELENMMAKLSSSSKKPSSSSKKVESSDDSAEPESSSSEEECTGRRCKTGDSSSSKKSGGGNGGSGSGEGGEGSSPSSAESSSPSSATSGSSELARDAHFKFLDEFVDWKSGTKAVVKTTADAADINAAIKTEGFSGSVYDTQEGVDNYISLGWILTGVKFKLELNDYFATKSVTEEKDSVLLVIYAREDGSDVVILVETHPTGKCGTSMYFKDTQICDEGVVKVECGETTFEMSSMQVCDEGVVKGFCAGGVLYDVSKQFCDNRGDGTLYKKVTIGGQTWMAENLKYETEDSRCYKDDCSYGRFYSWSDATNNDVCPTGWHVPSRTELEKLVAAAEGVAAYDDDNEAAAALKSETEWATGGNGDNTSGFNAFPYGYYLPSGAYGDNFGKAAYFWSSDGNASSNSYALWMKSDLKNAPVGSMGAKVWANVRCVMD